MFDNRPNWPKAGRTWAIVGQSQAMFRPGLAKRWAIWPKSGQHRVYLANWRHRHWNGSRAESDRNDHTRGTVIAQRPRHAGPAQRPRHAGPCPSSGHVSYSGFLLFGEGLRVTASLRTTLHDETQDSNLVMRFHGVGQIWRGPL